MNKKMQELLGSEADNLLNHQCKTIPKEKLHLPSPNFIDDVVSLSDRRPGVLRSLAQIFNHGRLAGTGYVSILPVDQGVEHSAGASFAIILITLTRRTWSSWPLKGDATPSHQHWEPSAPSPAATPTKSLSSSNSTTMSC